MRIIGLSRLKEFGEKFPELKEPLRIWFHLASRIYWGNLTEVCQTFGTVDFLRGGASNAVVSFKIGGSAYRLVTAIHFESHRLFILKVMERQLVEQGAEAE